MNFSEFFIRKPVFCIVLSTFILLIGFLSLLDLPLRQYPDTEKSIVTIDFSVSGYCLSGRLRRDKKPINKIKVDKTIQKTGFLIKNSEIFILSLL